MTATTKVINHQKALVAQLIDASCASCASVIEYHFNKLDAITVAINLANKKAYFNYDATKWSINKIAKEMKNIGYPITDIEDNGALKHQGHSSTDHNNLESEHAHDNAQHDSHVASHHMQHLHKVKIREIGELIIGIILLIPLLIIMIPSTPALDPLRNMYTQLVLTTIIQFYIGRKFYLGSYRELVKQKWPGMYTLVAFGTLTAYFFSIYLMITNNTNHLFFEVGASIIVIVLLGDLISDVVQTQATNGLESLMNLAAKEVLVFDPKNNSETTIKMENIQLNDILIVRKGEAIPTDGVLLSDQALVNEALLTGEANAIVKSKGEALIGGTVNLNDNFRMQATKIGQETILASIISAVETVQAQKPKLQTIADRIAGWFTPVVILIALLVFVIRFWAFHDNASMAIETAVATLVIACPCALGIATPLAVAVGINKAAKLGIIYNQASAFEKITKIDTICFDKTGTLTTGQLAISKIYDPNDHIKLALSLENYSTHPIAKTFRQYQQGSPIKNLLAIKSVKEEIGVGLTGKWEGKDLQMASLNYLLQNKMILSQNLAVEDWTVHNNKLVIGLAIDQLIVSIFILEDKLQIDAINTIAKLQAKGIATVLISGDNEQATTTVAQQLNINQFFANVTPIDKATIVKSLQAKGQKVAFVGDGVNDSVALQQADLAIAMGSGSDIAKKNGDLTIANNNISAVYQAIVLTKRTKLNIWMNFIWAFGYNIIVIPLAAVGFIIPPLAAFAMAFSDLTVVTNSLIFKIRKEKFN